MSWIFRSKQFTALPKTIERRNNRTRYNILKYLLNEMCIELWYRRHIAHVPQTPRYIEHLYGDRSRLPQHFQMGEQCLRIEHRGVRIFGRLY